MEQMTTNDIFSNSFIAMQNSLTKISPIEILLNLSVSLFVGLFIYYIYRKTFQGVLYQKSFAISLVTITMVTTLVIMIISGNLILSLGMVGALSIVRFRTPIKDPVDLVFIFWAITVGIANGVSYFNISIIGSIFLTIVLLFMSNKKEKNQPYLLILELLPNSNSLNILSDIEKLVDKSTIKSQLITESTKELILEIRLDDNRNIIDNLEKNSSIKKVTLISYSGDMSVV